MPLLQWFLGMLLLSFALILTGCGSSDSNSPSKIKPKVTVMVMRHCVRSTQNNGIGCTLKDGIPLQYMDNYSSAPWPGFSVPVFYCLPRGAEIIEAQGRWLKENGGLPLPVRGIADDIGDMGQRDVITLLHFLKGLGIEANSESAIIDHLPFAPSNTPACRNARPNISMLVENAKAHMAANPPPKGYRQDMGRLFEVMGTGIAGNWTGEPCSISVIKLPGYPDIPIPVGACQAASEFTERLLMEWGGGMTVGWGKLSASEVPRLLALHSWHFFNWMAAPLVTKVFGSSIIQEVFARLSQVEGPLAGNSLAGTHLFVGHDSDLAMLLGAFGLTWNASPFPVNATLPGSILRFDREGDLVTASYLYVANFSASDGAMLSVPANFTTSSNQISMKDLQRRVEQGSIRDCANTQAVNVEERDVHAFSTVV